MLRRGWMIVLLPGLVATGALGQKAEKVKIRPTYEQGRRLRYQLGLSGATAWAPTIQGIRWGRMKTDFTFVLATKVLREEGLHKGCCTFNLVGEHLRSVGEGPDGAFGIDTTRERTQVKVKDRWQVSVEGKGPLTRPMTMTFGPLGGFRFGTGLVPVAIYMLPHVDKRFWTLLTIAPVQEVAPGDGWEKAFELPVPGSKGKPLELKGAWKCVGWQTYRRRKVLAMTLDAELDLKDSNVMLKNGDLVHVATGTYKAAGQVLWDVENGVLCSAAAEQKILIKASKPSARALRSECKCSLQLLAAREASR